MATIAEATTSGDKMQHRILTSKACGCSKEGLSGSAQLLGLGRHISLTSFVMSLHHVQALASIEIHKVELEKAKAERKFKEECEVIRAKIDVQPPRGKTESVIGDLNAELVQLEDAYRAAATTLELRRKQFTSLLAMVRWGLLKVAY